MIDRKKLEKTIRSIIESEENLGEQAGGSGHLSNVSYTIDRIGTPFHDEENWSVLVVYTIVVETEFTVYPDRPPYERTYARTIIVDKEGNVVDKGKKTGVS